VALKKSDLYSSLWRSCDELRGGMDASQYKDYILTLLFVKYVSDKAKAHPDSLIEVPAGASFDDMVALRGDVEIGDKINKIIGRLAKANGLERVIDQADFNDSEKLGDGKAMQDRLSKLVAIFADLDFTGSTASGDDLLGDAYEYLMRHFATESGKSKGQFYTPAEVSQIMARVIGIGERTVKSNTVYDPTCGSGSLLLKAADEAPYGLTIYGQEKDVATYSLARMNMILHGNEDAKIERGDTIVDPKFHDEADRGLRTFDFAVANPPFSMKAWSSGLEREWGRFEFGRPPEKNGDYAFLLHLLKSLRSRGTGVIVMPHGVLFRGNAEGVIRTGLVKRGYIAGIIGLPPNLFYGTGIPACLIVLDKANAAGRTGIFMIDASKGFMKDGAKNRLRPRDIHQIVDTFNARRAVPRYSRMVPITEIASEANAYNLNLPRYIDTSEPEDIQDLGGHIHGGIPERDIDALNDYWRAFPRLRAGLFRPNRPGYLDLAVEASAIRATVLESEEFRAFAARVGGIVDAWFAEHRPILQAIDARTDPKPLIGTLSEDLLRRFDGVPLLDPYAPYEQLMQYWAATMQDDVFLIRSAPDWLAAAQPRPARIVGKDANGKDRWEDADLRFGTGARAERWVMNLMPPALVVARYFADEAAEVDELDAAAEQAAADLAEYVEENAVDEGPLEDALDSTGKVTKASANACLRLAVHSEDEETQAAARRVIELIDGEATAKKTAKDAREKLDRKTLGKYADLTVPEVKHLVLDDKWLGTLQGFIGAEAESVGSVLVARLQTVGGRYAQPVDWLDRQVASAAARVGEHLVTLGVTE